VLKLSTTPCRRVGKWRYSSTHSLTSALDGGEWSASRPDRFNPRERAPGAHWIGGPRAVLDAVVKRKIPSPRRESNPRTPIVQLVTQRYTDWAITALSLPPTSKMFVMTMNTSDQTVLEKNLMMVVRRRRSYLYAEHNFVSLPVITIWPLCPILIQN
jgi:hypothetical protein